MVRIGVTTEVMDNVNNGRTIQYDTLDASPNYDHPVTFQEAAGSPLELTNISSTPVYHTKSADKKDKASGNLLYLQLANCIQVE